VDVEAGQVTAVGQHPLAPDGEEIVERIVTLTRTAVAHGAGGIDNLVPLSVKDLNPLAKVCHTQLIDDCRRSTPIN